MNQAPPNEVVAWLPWCLHNAGTKTVWTIAKRWDLPISWREIADACHDYSTRAREALHPCRLAATDGQVVRGRISLTQWQVKFVGPLPLAKNASFTLIAIDVATGSLFAWPCKAAD